MDRTETVVRSRAKQLNLEQNQAEAIADGLKVKK
jgi:hypothetical protein